MRDVGRKFLSGRRSGGQTGPRAGEALERFVNHPKAHAVLGKGPNKASIQYGLEGLQVDLRALPHESYGAAMQYFTGSKEHNILVRSRAFKLGLTLNEYGLFKLENEACVAGETEEEIYAALGLAWIPPELRENCGEIEPPSCAGRSLPMARRSYRQVAMARRSAS